MRNETPTELTKDVPEVPSSDSRELAKRVEALEERVATLVETDKLHLSDQTQAFSRFLALHSMVMEIAKRQEIEPGEFKRHYMIREHFFYNLYLNMASRQWPELVAAIDKRHPNSAPAKASFPALFPDNNENT